MAGLADQSTAAALAAIAAREEAHAAGVACALACATAAALVELTTALATDRVEAADESARFRGLCTRAGELRARMLAAADEDVAAYGRVGEAGDDEARRLALERASEPPLAIAEAAAEVAEAAAEVIGAGSWRFTPDATVGAELARAAARGAAGLVAANLGATSDDERLARARAAAQRAEAALAGR